MERLGKILVFVNLGMSLCFATWALIIFATRLDLSTQKASGDKPEGLTAQRMAEFEKIATAGIRPADRRFRTNRADLAIQERWLPYERAWFANELNFVRTGDTREKTVRQVVRGDDGLPIATNDPAPGADLVQMQWPFKYTDKDKTVKNRKDRAGKDDLKLKSHKEYADAIEIAYKSEEKGKEGLHVSAMRALEAANKEKDFTDKLAGVEGKSKGLHAQLPDEYIKQVMLEAEFDELRPAWLNSAIELRNLEELRERLDSRIKELGGEKAVIGRSTPRD